MSSPFSFEHTQTSVMAPGGQWNGPVPANLTMPVLNGLEATRLIKATHATRESSVIAYTGNGSMPPPLERCFVAIVSKPSPPDVVLAAVQNAVGL